MRTFKTLTEQQIISAAYSYYVNAMLRAMDDFEAHPEKTYLRLQIDRYHEMLDELGNAFED